MIQDVLKESEDKMKKSIANLKSEMATIRSGRASTGMVDHIMVEAYGTEMPMNQVASISIPEARTILIQPWDKSVIKEIEKAIQKSDLGLNPSNDGNVIRINLPDLTEERRKEMVKQARSKAEDGRIAIRNIRRTGNDHIKALEKEDHISEDDIQSGLDDMQKLTDKYIKDVDDILEHKEKDIVTI
jgi:ribosome recycling factor